MRSAQRSVNRDGAALLTVLGIVFAVCLVLGGVIVASNNRAFMAVRLSERAHALMIAEAGACQAYSTLATNFSLRNDASAFPLTTYDSGTYDVAVTGIGSNKALICSTGVYGRATESVMLDLENYPVPLGGGSPGTEPGTNAFDYAIVSGSTMTFGGSGRLVIGGGGKVHANAPLRITGTSDIEATNSESSVKIERIGNASIYGDTAAPAYRETGSGHITGEETTGAVSRVTIPDIDMTPYGVWAQSNGAYYATSQHFTGSGTLQPPGGVMWVNGDLTINMSGSMVGCFIATGNITVTGTANHTKAANYPAFVSINGTVDMAGDGTYHGLIYAKNGNVSISGGGQIIGSVMAAGNFDKTGSWSIMTYEDSTPTPPGTPGYGPAYSNVVGVTAWQR